MPRRQPAADDSETDSGRTDREDARDDRRRTRWGRLAAVLAVLALAAAWFAPAVLARTGFRHTLLHRVFPELHADVTVDRADLGWLSPVELSGVEATPPAADAPLLTVRRVRTSLPLHALLRNAWLGGPTAADGAAGPADYGTVTLVRPELLAAVRPGGSDAEDLLSFLWEGESSGPAPGWAVEIEDGSAALAGPAGDMLRLSDLNGTLAAAPGAGGPGRAEFAADLGDGETAGLVTFALLPAEDGATAASRWTLTTEAVPLAAAGPALARFAGAEPLAGEESHGANGGGWSAGGALSAGLSGTLSADGWTARGRVSGERVSLRSAAWPAGDRLLAETASLAGAAAGGAGGVRADGLELTVPWASLSADGPLPTAVPDDPSALLDDDRRLAGRVDLARLSAMLPGLLAVRDGARVEGGTLTFAASTAAGAAAGTRTLTAEADAPGLRVRVADAGGRARTVEPDGPVTAQLTATRTADGLLTVERLTASADGLSLRGRGTADDLSAEFDADLPAFHRTFGAALDLGAAPAGTLVGEARLRAAGPGRYDAGVRATGTDLVVGLPGGGTVREASVTARVSAALRRGADGWTADRLTARAEAGGDRVTLAPGEEPGRYAVTLIGDLARWQRRAAGVIGESPVSLAGDIRASAGVTVTPAVSVTGLRAEFARLAVDGPGVRVREAAATLTGDAAADAAGAWSGRGEATAGSVTLSSRRWRWNPAAATPLTAQVAATGDPGQASRWFPALAEAGVRAAGRFAANGTINAGPAGAGATGEATFAPLTVLTRDADDLGGRWAVAWEEPHAVVAGSARYRFAADRFAADRFAADRFAADRFAADRFAADGSAAGAAADRFPGEPIELRGGANAATADRRDLLSVGPLALAGAGWSAAASGTVADPAGAADADLTGTLTTEWATLGPRLGWDGAAEVVGTATRPLRALGPFGDGLAGGPDGAPRARVGLAWDRLAAAGIDFGPGDVTATLSRGRVRIDGVDWPALVDGVPSGRVATTPLLDFTGPEAVLRLPAGRALDGVRVTPGLARGWLGLLSPLAAGSAAADGTFSLDLDGAALPLADAAAGDLRRASAGGRLEIERAAVAPGPVADRLLSAVRAGGRLLGRSGEDLDGLDDPRVRFDRQSVPFRVTGGRAYHQGLTASVGTGRAGSAAVTTTGSVGVADGTLDLAADLPVGGRDGTGNRRTVRLPVGGTLAAPRVDAAALAAAAAGGAVERFLGDELGLDPERADALERRAARELEKGLGRLFGRE